MTQIEALVPLAELTGYAARLHALTQGAGSFTMEPADYRPAPAAKAQELAGHFRRKDEDD